MAVGMFTSSVVDGTKNAEVVDVIDVDDAKKTHQLREHNHGGIGTLFEILETSKASWDLTPTA
jgi:hypothetical protein